MLNYINSKWTDEGYSMNIITQIKELTAYLNSCRNKYYNQGTSEIPDQEYDALLE